MMMFLASSEKVWPCFSGIVQSSSIVVIADYSYQLTSIGDCFGTNQHFIIVNISAVCANLSYVNVHVLCEFIASHDFNFQDRI